MNTKSKVLERIKQFSVEAKKSLGQNFLINDRVIEKIILQVTKLKPTSILEIGPGLGSLTDELEKIGVDFQLLELDRKFVEYWKSRNLNVIECDALHWDWHNWQGDGRVLVSNLPYQISSSLVIDRSLDENPPDFMILMFQKEVAQRIRAQFDTSDYGMLSVVSQVFLGCIYCS